MRFNVFSEREFWAIVAVVVVCLLTLLLRWWKTELARKHEVDLSSKKPSVKEILAAPEQNSPVLRGKCCLDVVMTRTFGVEEVRAATKNYRIRIGVGATSYVYLAELEGGRLAAVKRVMEEKGGSKKVFLDEVSVLLRISHPNLVAMLGFCFDKGEQLLVLEYMPNKSLFDRMHTKYGQSRGVLSWSNRMTIALDVARALDYLHSVADPPVIHRDVKSSNVLLVDDSRAKLADFGLCKLGHDPQTAQTPTIIKGSFGYLDNNYLNTGRVSPKSDVYSFGVLLLELITGLRSTQGSTTLAEWTQERRIRSDDPEILAGLLDPKLKGDANLEQLKVLIDIVNLALIDISGARPDMSYITSRISNCLESSNHFEINQDLSVSS
ncbi:probable leucine-rich repeat receptor-like protein kinase At5g49770 [Impatiens glandulifera]|uniref:probable leucine-rich repeat receptor-like protein kinase At5g49770 n=1 Tax=Impatiens glandulifera TaxID=253017 RepID=UPI001FB0D009|nr:probable leucine-rich repeat receptor-like protein kinase At5g49770 [Impatiens glandulifera]